MFVNQLFLLLVKGLLILLIKGHVGSACGKGLIQQ